MSGRRLIGVDLAWGERNPSGCAELVRDGGELRLSRLALLRSLEEIVEWIEPERGDWAVAIDAPLVIRNQTGPRAADAQADEFYRRFHAGAYPANLDRFGQNHRGGRLLRMLAAEPNGGRLVEGPAALAAPRLVFETYPHIVTVELFGLDRIVKYKKGTDDFKRRGQQQLVEHIREHFCGPRADPRLRPDAALEDLLREPDAPLRGRALKDREELLDGLISAYMAAWLDAGRPVQGLGEVGAGVMVVPQVRGIRRGARQSGVASARGTAVQTDRRAVPAPAHKPRDERRIALLIDCENESAAHVERILQIAAKIGRVVQMNAYADWKRPEAGSWEKACEQHGIRQVLVNRTRRGKNTVDNYMSADAAALAQGADIDAVCLVTSDSDFSGAATVVRAAGKKVYGIGTDEGHFAKHCTEFFRLDKPAGR